LKNPFTSFKERIVEYFQLRFEIAKLELIEKVVNVLSYLLFTIVVLFLLFTTILFLGFGVAIWLSDIMQSNFAGYFATFGIILLLVVIVLWQSKSIINFFANKILIALSASVASHNNKKRQEEESEED